MTPITMYLQFEYRGFPVGTEVKVMELNRWESWVKLGTSEMWLQTYLLGHFIPVSTN